MTKHLEERKKIAYYELCIINLIEAIDNIKELRGIKDYLKDVIENVEPNTTKENANRIVDLFKQIDGGDSSNEC